MIKVIITAGNVSSIDTGARKMLETAGFDVEEYPEAINYSDDKLINLLSHADAVIAGMEKYPAHILEKLPGLKLIARRGAGVDNIDLDAANKLGITVTRTEGIVGPAVAELIMAYLLDHARLLSVHSNNMKEGIWHRRLSTGLKGKTLGLIGFGSIAKETSRLANAFGMKVLCYHRHRDPVAEEAYSAEYTDFNTLVSSSDYISICVPLTNETRNMFNRDVFRRMKASAVLINTARSAIVNTADLIEALNTSQIAGAYIDVYDHEPCHDMNLLSCKNAYFTPHIGTFTKETFIAMNNLCARQVIEYFEQRAN